MSMESKTTFLNSLDDEKLGFFYAKEFDPNIEDLLQDVLNVRQFGLYQEWKKEEALLKENSQNDSLSTLKNIEALLEKITIRLDKLEENNESALLSENSSNESLTTLKNMEGVLEKLTSRLDKVEEKIDNQTVVFGNGTNRLDKLEEKSDSAAVHNDGLKALVTEKLAEHARQMGKLTTQLEKLDTENLTKPVLDKLAELPILFEKIINRRDKMEKDLENTVSRNNTEMIGRENQVMNKMKRMEHYLTTIILPTTPKITAQMNIGGVIFCAGGQDSSDKPVGTVQVYDSTNNKWCKLGEMNERRKWFGLVGAKGKVYAIGGYDCSSDLSSAEVFTPATGKWQSISPMSRAIREFGYAYSNGSIYVVGGVNDSLSRSNKAEKYDIESNKWTQLPDMIEERNWHGCAVLDGCVYAVGGSKPYCERYNPISNKWEKVASMNILRYGMGVCVLDGFIYAVGGYDGAVELSSVERYDNKSDTWTKVADLNTRRKDLSVAVMDGLLYAIGGNDGEDRLKSVEVYSPTLDKWTFVSDLDEAIYGAGAAWTDCSIDVLLAGQKKNGHSGN